MFSCFEGQGDFAVGRSPLADMRSRGDNSSMDAYMKLKKVGLLKSQLSNHRQAGGSSAQKDQRQGMDIYTFTSLPTKAHARHEKV